MIYIGNASPSDLKEPLKLPLLDFFSKYKPQTVKVTDDKEQMIAYKKYSALGFISGEMSELKRTNKNLIRRDALILDLDDIGDITENDLKQKIHNIFYEVDYVLYPSVSNGVKGVRYRLVLPITVPVEEQDYKLLIRFVTHKILADIIKKPDASNETWSQLMLLPIVTQYNPRESLITVFKGKQRFPTADGLASAKAWERNNKTTVRRNQQRANNYMGGRASYLNNMFAEVYGGCDEGGRNNRIAFLTKKFVRQGVKPSLMLEVALTANMYFQPPLSEKEVKDTVTSVCKTILGMRE